MKCVWKRAALVAGGARLDQRDHRGPLWQRREQQLAVGVGARAAARRPARRRQTEPDQRVAGARLRQRRFRSRPLPQSTVSSPLPAVALRGNDSLALLRSSSFSFYFQPFALFWLVLVFLFSYYSGRMCALTDIRSRLNASLFDAISAMQIIYRWSEQLFDAIVQYRPINRLIVKFLDYFFD